MLCASTVLYIRLVHYTYHKRIAECIYAPTELSSGNFLEETVPIEMQVPKKVELTLPHQHHRVP